MNLTEWKQLMNLSGTAINIDDIPSEIDVVQVIRCKDCGQREYGCSTFIDHNQIYGFCAWGWKAERKEE